MRRQPYTDANIGVGEYKEYEGEAWMLTKALHVYDDPWVSECLPDPCFVLWLFREGELRQVYVRGMLPGPGWSDVALAAEHRPEYLETYREARAIREDRVAAWWEAVRAKRGNHAADNKRTPARSR